MSDLSNTVGHEEFRDEVHVPIPAFSHRVRRFAWKVEALVELYGDTEPEFDSQATADNFSSQHFGKEKKTF